MRMYLVLGFFGLVLLLAAGCGDKYWYQEGKTFDQCKADRTACRADLIKRTDLRGIGDYERRFIKDCMQQKGYRLVSEKELPLAVKREGPDIPSDVPSDRGYGVAGTLAK